MGDLCPLGTKRSEGERGNCAAILSHGHGLKPRERVRLCLKPYAYNSIRSNSFALTAVAAKQIPKPQNVASKLEPP